MVVFWEVLGFLLIFSLENPQISFSVALSKAHLLFNAHLQPKAAGAGEARSYKKLDIDVVRSGEKQECRL